MIRVSIRLAGPLGKFYKRSVSAKGEEIELPDGSTIGYLLELYGIPAKAPQLIVVNRRKAELTTALRDGDEVRAVPLAAGG